MQQGAEMKEKPITVYLSEGFPSESMGADWSFLYPRPTNLFSDLTKERAIGEKTDSFLTCPAFSDITKKTIQYRSPMDASYEYDFTDKENPIVNPISKSFISFFPRDKSLAVSNTIFFELRYFMFADEPLEVFFTSPYFSQSKYTRYATIIPGRFDIGQWFRPYTFEVQPWSPKGEIHIEKDEPLFYAQFQTNRKIEIKRFEINEKIKLMASACVGEKNLFARQSMPSRYNMFNRIGLKGKLLTEIKKNIIEE
jgi:hypothetical protein